MEDLLELGGNIVLAGFKEIDGASMIVLKKIIGNYGRKFSEGLENYNNLSVTMKPVHENKSNKKYEIHAKLSDNSNPVASVVTERNIFVAVDSALKKIESQLN
jgi:ribosome-associated translation inhibitor RaiA